MIIKNSKEFDALREGGRKLAEILQEVLCAAKPGVTTKSLDEMAERLIRASGGVPSFKGYSVQGAPMSYPASLCVSVNNEVVHGIPSDRMLKKDDVVGLDIGMQYKGFYTDTASTVIVGTNIGKTSDVTPAGGSSDVEEMRVAKHLIQSTKEALDLGIAEVHA